MKNRKVFNFTGHEINYREFTIPSHGNIRVEERVSLGEPANSIVNVGSYKNGVGYGDWIHIDGFSESVLDYIRELESVEVADEQ